MRRCYVSPSYTEIPQSDLSQREQMDTAFHYDIYDELDRAASSPDPEAAAKMHPHLMQEHGSKLRRLWVDMTRPFILLTRSIICFLLSAYMAL